jgi:hypothetical protein
MRIFINISSFLRKEDIYLKIICYIYNIMKHGNLNKKITTFEEDLDTDDEDIKEIKGIFINP